MVLRMCCQVLSITKAINSQEVPTKEKHVRGISLAADACILQSIYGSNPSWPQKTISAMLCLCLTVALIGTHKDKSSALFWKIVTQHVQLQGNPVVCWKFCHVVHRLLRDGHPNVCACRLICFRMRVNMFHVAVQLTATVLSLDMRLCYNFIITMFRTI